MRKRTFRLWWRRWRCWDSMIEWDSNKRSSCSDDLTNTKLTYDWIIRIDDMDRSNGYFSIWAENNEWIKICCGSFEVAPLQGNSVFEPSHWTFLKVDGKNKHISDINSNKKVVISVISLTIFVFCIKLTSLSDKCKSVCCSWISLIRGLKET